LFYKDAVKPGLVTISILKAIICIV